jgi:hypothetical protein
MSRVYRVTGKDVVSRSRGASLGIELVESSQDFTQSESQSLGNYTPPDSKSLGRELHYANLRDECREDNDEEEFGELQICFPVKEAWNVSELFHLRYSLHKRAYQHKTVGAVELMISEALRLADPHLSFSSDDGRELRMSECCRDLSVYWRLSEYVIKLIEFSPLPAMEPARHLVRRLRKRDLFPFVGERLLSRCHRASSGDRDEVRRAMVQHLRSADVAPEDVADDDVICKAVKLGYGKGSRNPVDSTTFFDPRKTDGFIELGAVPSSSVSHMLPKEFEEKYIRVYCRYRRQRDCVKLAFDQVIRE